MATITVARPDLFPDGTVVKAYSEQIPNFNNPDVQLVGAGAASATMSGGTASLTGLADGQRYVVAAQVSGAWRRFHSRTTETTTGLAGVPHPSWRQRRRSLGLT